MGAKSLVNFHMYDRIVRCFIILLTAPIVETNVYIVARMYLTYLNDSIILSNYKYLTLIMFLCVCVICFSLGHGKRRRQIVCKVVLGGVTQTLIYIHAQKTLQERVLYLT